MPCPTERLRRIAVGCVSTIVAVSATVTSMPTAVEVAHAAGPLEISAWAPTFSTNVTASLSEHIGDLDETTLFFSAVDRSGTVVIDGNNVTKRNALLATARTAQQTGTPIIATITDGMDDLGMAALLADPGTRTQHVLDLVNFANANNFDGIDLDYETFAFDDPKASWTTTYDNWGTFLTQLSSALHGAGKTLQVSVPPIYDGSRTPKSGYWVYNYPVMATTVDRIKVMMYSYNVRDPGPNAPYDWVNKTMSFLKGVVPANRLVLGVPAYGSDWVTKVEGSCPANALALSPSVTAKRSLTTVNAAQAAANKGQVPTRDPSARENTYSSVESYSGLHANGTPVLCNVYRTAWYDDEQAVYERVLLARTLGLAGVAIWALGYESPSVWDAIDAVQAGTPYAPPAPIAPSVKAPAVVAPYPTPINAAGPLPARYLDTRKGYTTSDGLEQGKGPQPADSTYTLQVAGRGPVPGDASAVTLNVTVLGQGTGFVTVYPCGERPTTSSLNVRAGQTISNTVITRLSAAGKVCIYTQAVADLVVDVFSVIPADAITALDAPARLLDTRSAQPTIDGKSSGIGAIDLNGTVEVQVAGRGGVSASAASAVLNVTAVDAVGNGYLTVWPCGTPQPTTSNVNFGPGAAIPNAVVTALSAAGSVCIFASNRTHVIVDVFGQFASATYDPVDQAGRLLDTRSGYTTIDNQFNGVGKSALNQIREIAVGGRAGLRAGASNVVLNVTVVDPDTAGYVTVYACGTARPPVSNVNFADGQTLPNLVVTALSPTGTVCVYSSTATHVLVDVFGELDL